MYRDPAPRSQALSLTGRLLASTVVLGLVLLVIVGMFDGGESPAEPSEAPVTGAETTPAVPAREPVTEFPVLSTPRSAPARPPGGVSGPDEAL